MDEDDEVATVENSDTKEDVNSDTKEDVKEDESVHPYLMMMMVMMMRGL